MSDSGKSHPERSDFKELIFSTQQRPVKTGQHTAKFNAMCVNDALQGKVIKVVDDRQAHTDCNEYKEL